MSDPRIRPIKLYLNPTFLAALREHYLSQKGKTEESWDRWVEDCVIVVEPLED